MSKLSDEQIKQNAEAYIAWANGNPIQMSNGVDWLDITYDYTFHITKGASFRPKPQPDPYQIFRDAEKSGKVIQALNMSGEWFDASAGALVYSMSPNRYRIKPDPEYIPFTRDTIPMPCVIKNKKSGNRHMVFSLSADGVFGISGTSGELAKIKFLSYEQIFKESTLEDGSACGTMKE